jgi:hypothetical protein
MGPLGLDTVANKSDKPVDRLSSLAPKEKDNERSILKTRIGPCP